MRPLICGRRRQDGVINEGGHCARCKHATTPKGPKLVRISGKVSGCDMLTAVRMVAFDTGSVAELALIVGLNNSFAAGGGYRFHGGFHMLDSRINGILRARLLRTRRRGG